MNTFSKAPPPRRSSSARGSQEVAASKDSGPAVWPILEVSGRSNPPVRHDPTVPSQAHPMESRSCGIPSSLPFGCQETGGKAVVPAPPWLSLSPQAMRLHNKNQVSVRVRAILHAKPQSASTKRSLVLEPSSTWRGMTSTGRHLQMNCPAAASRKCLKFMLKPIQLPLRALQAQTLWDQR